MLILIAHNNQDDLIKARDGKHDPKDIAQFRTESRQLGRKKIESTFENEEVDLIIAPADSPLAVISSAAGKCSNSIAAPG
jgi:hypothetical protein